MIRSRFLIFPVLLFAISNVYASGKKAGTSGAQFLKIGAGARPTALGDAFVGAADDVNALYYNPGGLGLLQKAEIMAMHTQYFQGLNYNFGAYVQPTKHGTVGLSIATLQTDALTRRDVDESSSGTFENQDAAYTISYGHSLGETFGIGGNMRWIREQIDSTSASAWAGDVGILKRFEEHPVSVGFAIRHFGTKVKFQEESDPLPLTLDGGATVRLLEDRLLVLGDVRHIRDTGIKFGLGTEWRNAIFGKIRYAGRIGYNSANTDPGGANGMSVGAGLGYKQFDFDFAWIPFGDLGNTFRYAAKMQF